MAPSMATIPAGHPSVVPSRSSVTSGASPSTLAICHPAPSTRRQSCVRAAVEDHSSRRQRALSNQAAFAGPDDLRVELEAIADAELGEEVLRLRRVFLELVPKLRHVDTEVLHLF